MVAIVLLCIAGSSIAYSMFWVTSNTVHVDSQYNVVLSSSVSFSTVTLNAAVTNNGAPVGSGITVDFYYSTNGGVDWTYFNTGFTDAGGVAHAVYTVIANGGYDFRAVVTIP